MIIEFVKFKELENKKINLKSPTLKCRKILTVYHDARVETGPRLLSLAYAVSFLEEINLALREFEDFENMINHYNKCLKNRFFRCQPGSVPVQAS